MLCLHHANCTDGFGAAWVIHHHFDEPVEFKPVQYGQDAPDVTGKDVIIVDFSYPRDILLKMNDQANSLIVIDHHKTAEEQLKDLGFCIFDMNKSGCVLTWEYFFPNKPIPHLLLFLQDRDLWKWELKDSKAVNAGLRSYPADFVVWENFILLGQKGIDILKTEGKAILRYQQQQVDLIVGNDIKIIEIAGHQVPCLNSTHLISEIGNELAKVYPFAVMYFDTVDKRIFSLRSIGDFDVSEIAKQFGGGGHRNAAGFTTKKPKVL